MDAHDTGLAARFARLIRISTSLGRIYDRKHLLEQILEAAQDLTSAEGATLYLVKDRVLQFAVVKNNKLAIACGAHNQQACEFPAVPLFLENGEPNLANICSYAAFMRRTVRIDNAYDSEFNFSGLQHIDESIGYHSISFLTVPLLDYQMRPKGVLQLINRMGEGGEVEPFTDDDVQLVEALSSQAAVVLENSRLLEISKQMFEALIEVVADAVDQRSPNTGRHSRRVPEIAVRLATACNRRAEFDAQRTPFSPDQIESLRLAALLHDVGKISIPDALLDKSSRLWYSSDQIELIKLRYIILQLSAQLESLGQKPDESLSPDLSSELALLENCNNQATMVDAEARESLQKIAEQRCFQWEGATVAAISPSELYSLSTERGTLTEAEREILQSHPLRSFQLLNRIPFPEGLSQVPVIARNHHERVDGKGYPHRLNGDELDHLSLLLPLADIFEALTAPDRAYRKPLSVEDAQSVLQELAAVGHLDPDLVALFIDEGVGFDYGRSFLEEWQWTQDFS